MVNARVRTISKEPDKVIDVFFVLGPFAGNRVLDATPLRSIRRAGSPPQPPRAGSRDEANRARSCGAIGGHVSATSRGCAANRQGPARRGSACIPQLRPAGPREAIGWRARTD